MFRFINNTKYLISNQVSDSPHTSSTMTGVDILNTCTLKKNDMKLKIFKLLANAPVRVHTEMCSLFQDFWPDKIRKQFKSALDNVTDKIVR